MTTPLALAVLARARLERAQYAHQESVARIAAFFQAPEWLEAIAQERRTAAQLKAAQQALARAEAADQGTGAAVGG